MRVRQELHAKRLGGARLRRPADRRRVQLRAPPLRVRELTRGRPRIDQHDPRASTYPDALYGVRRYPSDPSARGGRGSGAWDRRQRATLRPLAARRRGRVLDDALLKDKYGARYKRLPHLDDADWLGFVDTIEDGDIISVSRVAYERVVREGARGDACDALVLEGSASSRHPSSASSGQRSKCSPLTSMPGGLFRLVGTIRWMAWRTWT